MGADELLCMGQENGIQEAHLKKELGEDNQLNTKGLIQMELSDEEVPENIDPGEDADLHDTFNVQNDTDIQNQNVSSGWASQKASPGEDLLFFFFDTINVHLRVQNPM